MFVRKIGAIVAINLLGCFSYQIFLLYLRRNLSWVKT